MFSRFRLSSNLDKTGMRQSYLLSKTKKQPPKGAATISHQYLVRADFVDQLAAGIYTYLPLGWRVYKKIENIIREEMDNLGAQELLMPALIPKTLWEETRRWEAMDPPLFVVKDRHGKEYGLGSTHEEVITDLVRKRIQSYQDLPFSLYQIQNKFRNEMRSTGGLLRVREFIMKDLYSFHATEKELKKYYEKAKQAYINIFHRCGLIVTAVEAESGSIGGSISHEFMLLAKTGEDKVAMCPKCGFGANLEKIGDTRVCPECGSPLEVKSCIEAGHTFYLGDKYSADLKASFVDKDGQTKPIQMGCYGIGLGRLMAAIVEASHDKQGIIWPQAVAPFKVHLVALFDSSGKVKEEADKIYLNCKKQDIEILYDDRDKSPGEKFADADLIGVPLRVVISEKTLTDKKAEIKKRKSQKVALVLISDLISKLK